MSMGKMKGEMKGCGEKIHYSPTVKIFVGTVQSVK